MPLLNERRAIVCGSRNGFQRKVELERALREALARWQFEHVIVGSVNGVDQLALVWAVRRAELTCTIVAAKWKAHGLSAGPRRNTQMLVMFEPHVVLAFPGGDGTADMVRQAVKHGVPTLRWEGREWVMVNG